MYPNAQSRMRINGKYSQEFGMGVDVHQDSTISAT